MKISFIKRLKALKRWQFYLLSFTWGLPMSLVGLLVCGTLLCFGYKPKRYGHCWHIEIGKNWGGVNFGWLFLTGRNSGRRTKDHEVGHGYQNACMLGWLTPIFSLISMARYWLKQFGAKFDYYSWWFEAQANKIGAEVLSDGD